jgi:hypothetical protein
MNKRGAVTDFQRRILQLLNSPWENPQKCNNKNNPARRLNLILFPTFFNQVFNRLAKLLNLKASVIDVVFPRVWHDQIKIPSLEIFLYSGVIQYLEFHSCLL